MYIHLYGRSFETQETTIAAGPRYPSIFMVGNVRFSGVLFAPGIEPADRPSHSYRNRKPFCAGCSTMTTYAPRGPLPLPFAPLGFICPGFCGWVFCVICADVAACGIWLLFWFWSTAIMGVDTIESNGGRCTSASPNTGSALAIASTARQKDKIKWLQLTVAKKQLNMISQTQSQIYTFVARTRPQGQCIRIYVGKNHLQFIIYKNLHSEKP